MNTGNRTETREHRECVRSMLLWGKQRTNQIQSSKANSFQFFTIVGTFPFLYWIRNNQRRKVTRKGTYAGVTGWPTRWMRKRLTNTPLDEEKSYCNTEEHISDYHADTRERVRLTSHTSNARLARLKIPLLKVCFQLHSATDPLSFLNFKIT